MADEKELNDLRARIGRLNAADRAHLFELVFADERQKYDDTLAWMAASQAAYLEAEKLLHETRGVEPFPFPPEAKREAG